MNELLEDQSHYGNGKGIGLVAAQVIIEAYSRMMNGLSCILYIHTHKRAGVRACGRAGVRACERGQK